MKYNISINQKVAIDLKLDIDIIDLAIFDMLKDFSGSTACKKMQDNSRSYFSVPYKKVLDELPLLPINKPDGIYRRFKKLELSGIIEMHPDNAKLSMVWFCWGRNYDAMIFDAPRVQAQPEIDTATPGLLSGGINRPHGLLSEGPPDEKPTHYNTYSFSSSSSNSKADFENDWKIKETFVSVRRIPETKYATYLDAFCKEIAATGEAHNNRAQLVKHFLNWSEIRYRIETTPARAAGTGGAPSKFTPAPQEPKGAAYKPFPKYDY